MDPIFGWLMFCAIAFLVTLTISILTNWAYSATNDHDWLGVARFFWVVTAILATAMSILTIISISSGMRTQ